jgi:hypothetical protein
MKRLDEARFLYPPLEGEGRLALSAAKCETGVCQLGHRSRRETVTPPRRSTGRRFASPGRVDPPPPGEGERRSRAHLHSVDGGDCGGTCVGGGGEFDGKGGSGGNGRGSWRQAPALRPAIIQ